MRKLVRNTSDDQSRAFWDSVKKSAQAVRTAPKWMRAGITLDERHFTTFSPRRPLTSEAPPASVGGE